MLVLAGIHHSLVIRRQQRRVERPFGVGRLPILRLFVVADDPHVNALFPHDRGQHMRELPVPEALHDLDTLAHRDDVGEIATVGSLGAGGYRECHEAESGQRQANRPEAHRATPEMRWDLMYTIYETAFETHEGQRRTG